MVFILYLCRLVEKNDDIPFFSTSSARVEETVENSRGREFTLLNRSLTRGPVAPLAREGRQASYLPHRPAM